MDNLFDQNATLPTPQDKLYHLDYYFKEPREYGNIRLVQIGRLYCDRKTVVEKHLHLNWFELTIVTDGEGTLTTNGVEIPIKRGDVYLSFPADRHGIISDAENPLKYDFFSFFTKNEEYAERLEKIMQKFGDPRSRLFSDEKIRSLVQNSISEFGEASRSMSEELISHAFEMILIYLFRDFPLSDSEETLVTGGAEEFCYNLMNYIDTHIFTLKNLEELAEVTNYNYSYLSSLFRKTTGRTLLDYYASCRLRVARSLIRENKMKIGEIAELLNYSSVYSFSKAYKNKYGICPTDARKK